jgi:hypothetical protein
MNLVKALKSGARIQELEATMHFLKSNISYFMCWGVQNLVSHEKKILQFDVNGFRHKGKVLIKLNGADLYDIYAVNNVGQLVDSRLGLYNDQLNTVVDDMVETGNAKAECSNCNDKGWKDETFESADVKIEKCMKCNISIEEEEIVNVAIGYYNIEN